MKTKTKLAWKNKSSKEKTPKIEVGQFYYALNLDEICVVAYIENAGYAAIFMDGEMWGERPYQNVEDVFRGEDEDEDFDFFSSFEFVPKVKFILNRKL